MDEPVRPDPAAARDAAGPSAGQGAGPGSAPTPADPQPDPPPTPSPASAPPPASEASPPRRLPPLTPRVAVVLAGAVVVGIAFYLGRDSLRPFVVGLILAYLLDIPVERMARVGVPRWVSVLIVYAVFVVVFIQALRVVFRPLAEEIVTFIDEFPAFMAQVADMYAHLDLPPGLREAIDGWLDSVGSGVGGVNPGDLLPVVTGIAGLLGSIVGYVILPVWVFYLIKDRPALVVAAFESLPVDWREDARAVAGLFLRVWSQWLRGQLFLGLVVGVMTFIGLEILSVLVDPVFGRFAVLLSVIAGVLELLPIIGPIIAAIPAVILALTGGIDAAIAAIILYVLVQQIENNLLVPKIQGDAVELHPSIVMLALVVGGAVAGLLGAILALPMTAAARDIFRYAFHRVDDPPSTPAEAVAKIRANPTIVDPVPDGAGSADPPGSAPAGAGA